MRGGSIPVVSGLLAVGALSLSLGDGEAMGLVISVASNPAGQAGSVWVYQGVGGAPFTRVGVIGPAVFVNFTGVQIGPSLNTGQVVSAYLLYVTSRGELLARSSTATQVVP